MSDILKGQLKMLNILRKKLYSLTAYILEIHLEHILHSIIQS